MSRGQRARNEILDAAERLIAERGMQVSLREIAVAAGQRNHSAVNYYFHNRQDLIDAVVDRRLEPMERERALMLAVLDADTRTDIHALLRIIVLPLITVPSRYYARFLQLAVMHLNTDAHQKHGAVWPQLLEELARAIPTKDPDARRRRINAVGTSMFALLAERERTAHSDAAGVGSAEDIIGMLAAMLAAPLPSPDIP